MPPSFKREMTMQNVYWNCDTKHLEDIDGNLISAETFNCEEDCEVYCDFFHNLDYVGMYWPMEEIV